jgi:hypothetical protein
MFFTRQDRYPFGHLLLPATYRQEKPVQIPSCPENDTDPYPIPDRNRRHIMQFPVAGREKTIRLHASLSSMAII